MNSTFAILAAMALTSQAAHHAPLTFHEFYATSLRGSLFTGFLTLTGFLFAVKTFMIINLKKEVYDHAGYLDRVLIAREMEPKYQHYGELRRLNKFLLICVCVSFATSVSQFTIGLIPSGFASAFCLAMALGTSALLSFVLYLVRKNMQDWFDILEANPPARKAS